MKLKILNNVYSIFKLSSKSKIPDWVFNSSFYSVSKTEDELSIVCESEFLQDVETVENDWRIIQVVGPLDFSLTGILSSLTTPLADAKISTFAISTFDTDYLMVKADKLEEAIIVLAKSDFTIRLL